MAYDSPSQSRRHRPRHNEAGDFGDERDFEERSRGAHSAHHSTHQPTRPHHQSLRPIFIEINGGNNNLGSLLDDQLGRTSRSAAAPTRPNSRLRRKKRNDNLAFLAEDSDTSASYTSSLRDTSPLATQSRRFKEPKTPTSQADEGYGTSLSAGTALQHEKRGKAKTLESENASACSRWPPTTPSSKKSSTRKKPEPPTLEHASVLTRSSSVVSLRETPSHRALGKRKVSKRESDSDDGEQPDARLDPANLENEEEDDEDDEEYEESEYEDEGEERHADSDSDSDGDSDDDFAARTIKLEGANKEEIEIRAILDTGTKPNWISWKLLQKLGKSKSKLGEGEKKEYRDINGKTFTASGKVNLNIMCNDFLGFKYRTLPFLVSREGTFNILFGTHTIKDEKLLQTRAPDDSGEGVYPGVLSSKSKADVAKIAQNKTKQQKEAAEQKRKRDEKRAKEKQGSKSAPGANFAPESRTRGQRTRSPSRKPISQGSVALTGVPKNPPSEKLCSSLKTSKPPKQRTSSSKNPKVPAKQKASSSSLEEACW